MVRLSDIVDSVLLAERIEQGYIKGQALRAVKSKEVA